MFKSEMLSRWTCIANFKARLSASAAKLCISHWYHRSYTTWLSPGWWPSGCVPTAALKFGPTRSFCNLQNQTNSTMATHAEATPKTISPTATTHTTRHILCYPSALLRTWAPTLTSWYSQAPSTWRWQWRSCRHTIIAHTTTCTIK